MSIIHPLFLSVVCLLNSAAAFALDGETVQPGASNQAGKVISYADVLQWSLSLIVVLSIFGVLVWVLRKSESVALTQRRQLAVLAGLSLGMREKLVLIKVGEKQLLLGVSNGRIDKLMELEGEQRLFQQQNEGELSGTFAEKLQQILQGKANV